jgi:hypothetical protein
MAGMTGIRWSQKLFHFLEKLYANLFGSKVAVQPPAVTEVREAVVA